MDLSDHDVYDAAILMGGPCRSWIAIRYDRNTRRSDVVASADGTAHRCLMLG